jgi:uncharacterized protein YggU (UPF0235/DUF167 family)
VIPRARRSELAGVRNGALLVRLASPPVDGAANESLIRLLSTLLDLPRSAIRLDRGQRSRDKRVHLAGLDAQTAVSRLRARLPQP